MQSREDSRPGRNLLEDQTLTIKSILHRQLNCIRVESFAGYVRRMIELLLLSFFLYSLHTTHMTEK